jgi:hypothetical protein
MLHYIATSKQLVSLRTNVLQSHSQIEIDTTIGEIEAIKHITLNRIERANTAVCLKSISNVHAVIEMIENAKKRIFSWNNASHYDLIDRYWIEMFPNVRRVKHTVSAEWGELGFQGNDPATDFRGMGMLGLLQLEYFARVKPSDAKRVLGDSMHPRRYYPFSATGINVTAFVMELLRENRLHMMIIKHLETYCMETKSNQMSKSVTSMYVSSVDNYNTDCDNNLLVGACSVIHNVYCEVFIAFNDVWVDSDPPNIRSFAGIFNNIKASFRLKYPAI